MNKILVNNEIKSPNILLVGENGVQGMKVSKTTALKRAKSKGLDLVQVSYKNNVSVCRIIDANKYKYDIKKKYEKNKNKKCELKEIRISPNIADYDLKIKENSVKRLLRKGNNVMISVRLKGRERLYKDLAIKKINSLLNDLKDCIVIKKQITIQKSFINVIVRPNKDYFKKERKMPNEK